jgi:tRNA A37 methylthiotransferase MiaB
MKKVYIESNGCAVIRHDTQRYSKYFRLNGWKEIEDPIDADLILMTTCGVIKSTEDYALQAISRLKGLTKEGAQFIVGGCLPKINKDRLEEEFGGISFGPLEEETLDNIIHAAIPIRDVFWDGEIVREHSLGDPELHYTDREIDELHMVNFLADKVGDQKFIEIYNYLTKGRYLWKEQDLFEVKVADGCVYDCSYCGTKNAKGNLKSMNPDKVVREFVFGIGKGYQKILLTGDEVGEYGADIGMSLVSLLKLLIPESDHARIALRYMSPASLIRQYADLKPYFESGKIYYFCASFQSGSSRIIRLMNRPDNLDRLAEVVSEISHLNPFVYKHSQMIVGFPGETEDDFQQSLNFMEKSGFDYITMLKYSPRPNTNAIRLENKVPSEIIEDRYKRAMDVFHKIRQERLQEKIYSKLMQMNTI